MTSFLNTCRKLKIIITCYILIMTALPLYIYAVIFMPFMENENCNDVASSPGYSQIYLIAVEDQFFSIDAR